MSWLACSSMLLMRLLRTGAFKTDPAEAIIRALTCVTMASRVLRDDLRNITEPFEHGDCPICSDNQCDHLNADRFLSAFHHGKGLVFIPQ
jgi:hypothetical protein